ncbi:MAG: phosphopeptide-binding protein [Subtercola sp.]|nr:phosphopeptide-binding protein [Subtercola sp.]
MRLKFTLQRPDAPATDIVVTTDATATVGDIAAAIAGSDPAGSSGHPLAGTPADPVTLVVSPPAFSKETALSPLTPIGDAEIGSGFTVRVVNAAANATTASTHIAAIARVLTGPDAGREFELPAGESTLGRDPSNRIVLTDPLASKVHAKVIVADFIEIADLNSANGLLIDGGVVTRVQVDDHQTVTIGNSELGFRRVGAVAAQTIAERGGSLPFNRPPRVESRYPGRTFTAPMPPAAGEKMRFPWISLVAPLLTGVAMYAFFQSPFALLFVALAPVLVLGSYIDGGMNRRRTLSRDTERFDEELHDLSAELAATVPLEHAARNAEAPSTAEVYADAMQLGTLLWTRRPEHWSFLNLRLGTARLPSRNTVEATRADGRAIPELAQRVGEVVEPYAQIDAVPIVENPNSSGTIGVVGGEATADVVRGLLVQFVGLHSPAELVVAAIVSPRWSPEFAWLGWLPHTSSPQSPLGENVHLADSAATGDALLASLEALVDARSASRRERGPVAADEGVTAAGQRVGEPGLSPSTDRDVLPALALVVSDDAPVDRARLVQVAERAADAGVYVIWAAAAARDLPAVCRTWIDVREGAERASVSLVRLGRTETPVQCERVNLAQATALARRLAPLLDSGALVTDATDLPPSISFLTLVGEEFAEAPIAVVDRWRQNDSLVLDGGGASAVTGADRADAGATVPTPPARPRRAGSLRALVGVSGVDAMHLDLRLQGPHALVGGTTGSGKSEFLQAWVLGMATEYSPDRVTFLFVDYKGGSAFAECVSLPHSVGLVTDLSPHLVRRALTSLRAELQHRERLLGRKKAKDLLELEKRGDPECPPALVIVIDEFAALASDVPEFVDGVVDIAQRGRSLGIHLIMATQRPAGVIKDNLRANTNLRVALRMADEHDSSDVVGEKTAAGFDPSVPGRAIAKMGPGRVSAFQAAYVGGYTRTEPERAVVKVSELRFGAEIVWEPRTPATVVVADELGPNDEARLVSTIATAAAVAEVRAPRRPWLDELAPTYDLAVVAREAAGERADRLSFALGVADVPEHQLQQPVFFSPDSDGHLVVYGAGGAGKTVLLRTLAVAAALAGVPAGAGEALAVASAGDGEHLAVTSAGAGEHLAVYGIDFAGGGLRMLESLPHVGSVISGDDSERISRLLSMLAAQLDTRSRRFSELNAGTIAEYRTLSGDTELPRIVVVIDGFAAFRSEWETIGGRSARYAEFMRVLGEGRQLGIHIALSADRPGSVPSSVNSAVSRRVVLRLSDDTAYLMLDAPDDVLSPASPAGRAIVDGHETQVAVFGGSRNVLEQAQAIDALAAELARAGRPVAQPIRSLPTEIALASVPESVGSGVGLPVLGVADDTLQPIGFEPSGVLLVAGGPASGRTNALLVLSQSVRRWRPTTALYYLGTKRSVLAGVAGWAEAATNPDDVAELARRLVTSIGHDDAVHPIAVFVEGIGDFLSTVADGPVVDLIRAVRRSDHLLIAEAESSAWSSSWPLLAEVKNARRGIVLQPETLEGDSILRTSFPRVSRTEFPPGRGFYVAAGKVVRVQLPLAETGPRASTPLGTHATPATSPVTSPDASPDLSITPPAASVAAPL